MVLRRFVAVGTAVTLVAALAMVGGGAASAAPPGNHRGYVEVPDSAYTLQPGDIDLGKKQDDPIRFEGSLKVRNQAEAEALAMAVSDPSNRAYGQFLSPAEYRRRFAPTDLGGEPDHRLADRCRHADHLQPGQPPPDRQRGQRARRRSCLPDRFPPHPGR